MRTVILASVRTHARRYVAALVAVVIATGFIIAVNAISAAARDGVRAEVASEYTGTDVVVSGGDPAGLRHLADTAETTDGVRAVAVNAQRFTDVTWGDGTATTAVGTVADEPDLRWQELDAGRFPRSGREVLVSSSRAAEHDLGPGDTVEVGGDARAYTVSGVVADSTGYLGASVYLPETVMDSRGGDTRSSTGIASVVVDTREGEAGRVAEALRAQGDDTRVQSAASYVTDLQQQATQGVDIWQKLIYIFAGISLFVGALVIANTFTILLAQRARDFALLRCVGSLRRQVLRSVVTEAFALAVVGSAVGVGFGYAVAVAGSALLDRFVPQLAMGTPTLNVTGVVLPVVLGVSVTVLASFVPARRITRIPPLAALAPQPQVDVRDKAGRVRLAGAVALLIAGSGLLVAGLEGQLLIGMAGGMLSFTGILLLGPVLVPALIRLARPVARVGGVPGQMAVANAVRNPRRTASTSTALLIGVTLITTVVIGTASIKSSIGSSMDERDPIDMTLSSGSGAVGDAVPGQVREVDGVARVAELPGTTVRADGKEFPVAAVGKQAAEVVHGDGWFTRLEPGTIVLPAAQPGFPDVESGDSVRVHTGGEGRTLTVRYASGTGTTALVDASVLRTLGTSLPTRAVWVRAEPEANARNVSQDIAGIAQSANLEWGGGLQTRADVEQVLDVLLAVTVGLLAVSVLIALVGVGNTLSLSVLERVRESSLLRALGLPRAGLRLMLAGEALLMAFVAAVLGVGLGATYAWFGVRTVTAEVLTSAPGITVPWPQVLLIVLVAAAAGLLACLLPSRRAARIAPAAGLAGE